MKYEVLHTGSDGNATVINGKILIDIGVPYKTIEPYARSLKLVLLTHHHGDHFNPGTVKRMAKNRPTLRWGCCEWMVPFLSACGVDYRNIDIYDPDGMDYYYGSAVDDLAVRPEPLTHNVPNCGYHIRIGDESLFYATDTGSLDGIEAKGYNTYLVEANHREAELEARVNAKMDAGEFAYETAAAKNHLSYEQAVDWLRENMGPHSLWVPMHQHKERGNDDGREKNAVPENH